MKESMKARMWQVLFMTLIFAVSLWSETVQAFEFKGFGDITYADATTDAPATNGLLDLEQRTTAFKLGQFPCMHADN